MPRERDVFGAEAPTQTCAPGCVRHPGPVATGTASLLLQTGLGRVGVLLAQCLIPWGSAHLYELGGYSDLDRAPTPVLPSVPGETQWCRGLRSLASLASPTPWRESGAVPTFPDTVLARGTQNSVLLCRCVSVCARTSARRPQAAGNQACGKDTKACVPLRAGGVAPEEKWVRLSEAHMSHIAGALPVVWFIAE